VERAAVLFAIKPVQRPFQPGRALVAPSERSSLPNGQGLVANGGRQEFGISTLVTTVRPGHSVVAKKGSEVRKRVLEAVCTKRMPDRGGVDCNDRLPEPPFCFARETQH
jgi:hypothetical protein